MSLTLDQIVPWGRTAAEYERMFQLGASDRTGAILDCGGGPASLAAEWHEAGRSIVAVDPIYHFSGEQICSRFEQVAGPLMARVRADPSRWVWRAHRDPDDLFAHRRMALNRFLADYNQGLREGRYLAASLPVLPFARGTFRLALCSHLLFLYSDLLPLPFHLEAIRELIRVAHEVRIFPLLDLSGTPSPHLGPVIQAAESHGWRAERVPVDYEVQPGGNEMLRVVPIEGSVT